MPDRAVLLALGSHQPAKRAAVERVAPSFWSNWRIVTLSVPSGVREQPLSDDETVLGALERARNARSAVEADFGIGLESGVAPGPLGRLYVVSWAVVVDRAGRIGVGGSERFPLPQPIAERLRAGSDLASALASVLGTEPPAGGGTVAVWSAGRRQRVDLLAGALLLALVDLEHQTGASR
ncbi:inosine/xanthosine triphosphatase [Thermomicrobium sp. 4228-Ro]|uniref:inosine/xanthosine triphosphatase n=1 Tax=Thermomicrobium sp. 4228-Ro TaxID=2993937 RepID=UPI0022489976|nr:inosine/xanthosine triphosphatase [Thermomicrobium sp. 4228-Ro]MCX2728338.1 inosine/xanthosine triphosphatase [Thermomicrobium sp. 4228-Ro]